DFMAAVLSSYIGKNDQLIKYVSSCNHNGTPVLPPDINISGVDFTPTDEGIRFGLAGISNVGVGVVEAIVAEREANGPYTSLHDFVNRLDSKCYNRRALESLFKSGAFDSTGYTRKQLMYFIDETTLLADASKRQRDKVRGQMSMFDLFDTSAMGMDDDIPAPDGIEWDHRSLLAYEKAIMGVYVSDHPLRPYEAVLARMTKYNLGSLAEVEKDIPLASFVGMVTKVETKLTKKGKLMATFTLEDTTGYANCICFDYAKYRDVLVEDAVVRIRGSFEKGDRGSQIKVDEAAVIELHPEDTLPLLMELHLNASDVDSVATAKLNRLLSQYPGRDSVSLVVTQADGRKFRADLESKVDATNAVLRAELESQFGRGVLG
ncbi:MAG: DNA polymerase III subunit alpha, partial [Eggerthellaceae bacterium]|nr:DNA polymerase III subunit alpha [Eggerthellaceae bacterium]